MITQRAAVINKDVLTQAEVLIALRTIAPQDRAAIDAWIRVHGTKEQGDELMTSLPSLPVGTAWFWSSGWLNVFKRVEVGTIETFDSSATPKAGQQKRRPKLLAEVDIAAVRERLAATIEKAKAEDPRLLQAEIERLKKELAKKMPPAPAKADPAASEQAIAKAAVKMASALAGEVRPVLGRARREMLGAATVLENLLGKLREAAPPESITFKTSIDLPQSGIIMPKERHNNAAAAPARSPRPPAAALDGITRPQQAILDGLAWLEVIRIERATRTIAAFLANASPRSSGYENNVSALSGLGLVEYPDKGHVRAKQLLFLEA